MLKRLWNHLSKRRQKQFVLMQIFAIIVSFFEMASLGAVIPFLTVLAEPEAIFEMKYMQPFIGFFQITQPNELALPITLVFILLTMFSALVRFIFLWALTRLSQQAGADLSINIYRNTLYQDYAIHVARNSSEVINGIITKTTTVTKGVIAPVLNLISTSVTIIGIIVVLLAINISVTLTAFIGFGGLYLIVMYLTRKNLSGNSERIAAKSDLMVRSLQEGLEGIREVLLNSNQQFYVNLYKNSDLQMRKATWRNELIFSGPRFLMEAVGIGIVAIIAYLATLQLGGINQFLPLLGAFVLGAQKLLPAIQKAYASYSRVKGSEYSLDDVLVLLDQPVPFHADIQSQTPNEFSKSIELKNLSFRYSDDAPWILKDLSLTIPKGSVIGIVGTTGCGKSTLLDIIMSLLSPTDGELLVDNKVVDASNKRAWQSHISSVPQDIYLSDGTIEENIAFGISKENINHLQVKKAAKQAQINKLVESLEDGYETVVGERGMRLSGGQRQRIGVARAFYRQSDVLILDEATSALDDETELAVMDSINNFDNDITVIIIAHRLTTLKNCDMIMRLFGNHQTEIMSYEEIMNLKIDKGDQYVE
ncbi:ABC transporter ATP-binding protein/permease [Gammaproteobacteria bacterium]|nr:ABC transporter ATP-binding protein/permease [Gammaproteobacteria bacterium]